MPAALLEIRDLDVRYGAIYALRGVCLRVEAGQIVALLGANGAGKSTTLRTVSGLIRPTRGDILWEGRSIVGLPPHAIVQAGICHVPEGRGIFANLTVEENLRLGAYARRGDRDRTALAGERERVLQLFPVLHQRLRQNAGTLSGGEQQMLAIARALLARPRVLLLDEPSLGLAPQLVQLIFRIIREINQQEHGGTTVLLVEQNAHMALTAAQYAYVLEVGRIAMQGPAGDLARNPDIRRAYLGASGPARNDHPGAAGGT